jgi:hypothetical protein
MPGIHDVMQGLQWHVLKEWDISQSADKALEINGFSVFRRYLPARIDLLIRCLNTPLVLILMGGYAVVYHFEWLKR